jgi:hypothetical protein
MFSAAALLDFAAALLRFSALLGFAFAAAALFFFSPCGSPSPPSSVYDSLGSRFGSAALDAVRRRRQQADDERSAQSAQEPHQSLCKTFADVRKCG